MISQKAGRNGNGGHIKFQPSDAQVHRRLYDGSHCRSVEGQSAMT
jgi:hypothetical protein